MPSRRGLLCASPSCSYEVHQFRSDFGGFCCKACFSTAGRKHGGKCEKRLAREGAERAAPVPPNNQQPPTQSDKGNAAQSLSTPLHEPKCWVSEEDQLAEDANNLRVLQFSRPQSAPHLWGVICSNGRTTLFRRAANFMQETTGHASGTPDRWKDLHDEEDGLHTWWQQHHPNLGCSIAELDGENGVLRALGFGSKIEDRKRAANLALALTAHYLNPMERSPGFATVVDNICFQSVILWQSHDASTQPRKRPRCSPAPPASPPSSPPSAPFDAVRIEQAEAVSPWFLLGTGDTVAEDASWLETTVVEEQAVALEGGQPLSWLQLPEQTEEQAAEPEGGQHLPWLQQPEQTAPLAQCSANPDCVLDCGESCEEQASELGGRQHLAWLQQPEQTPSLAQCSTDPPACMLDCGERIKSDTEQSMPHQEEHSQKSLIGRLLDSLRNQPFPWNPSEQIGQSHPSAPEANEPELADPQDEANGVAPAEVGAGPLQPPPQPKRRPRAPPQHIELHTPSPGAEVSAPAEPEAEVDEAAPAEEPEAEVDEAAPAEMDADPVRLPPQPKCRPEVPPQRSDDVLIVRQLLLKHILDEDLVNHILDEEDFRSVSDLAKVADDPIDAADTAERLGLKGRTRQRRFVQAWQEARGQMPTPAPPCKPPPAHLLHKRVASPDAEEGIENDAMGRHSHQEPETDDSAVDEIGSDAGSEVDLEKLSEEYGDASRSTISMHDASNMPDEQHDAEMQAQEGKIVEAPISKVFHLQDNISARFQDGTPLSKLIEDLKQGTQDPMRDPHLMLNGGMANVPTSNARHAPRETIYYTFDHRRLYCMQQAGCPTVRLRINLSGRAFDEFISKARNSLGQRSTVKVNGRNREPWARHVSTWAHRIWAPGPHFQSPGTR